MSGLEWSGVDWILPGGGLDRREAEERALLLAQHPKACSRDRRRRVVQSAHFRLQCGRQDDAVTQ